MTHEICFHEIHPKRQKQRWKKYNILHSSPVHSEIGKSSVRAHMMPPYCSGVFFKLKTDSLQSHLEGRENPGTGLLFINHLLQSLE